MEHEYRNNVIQDAVILCLTNRVEEAVKNYQFLFEFAGGNPYYADYFKAQTGFKLSWSVDTKTQRSLLIQRLKNHFNSLLPIYAF